MACDERSTLAQFQMSLDLLSRTARSGDSHRYCICLTRAQSLGASHEQVDDAYRWGRTGMGAADFGPDGEPLRF